LYTSLNAKFTLAARARAAEHARARRGAAAARPANCVEGLANLPLLVGLGSAGLQAGVVVCCDDWPAMLNGCFGWLSSLAPVAGPTESVAEEELAACEEASDEGPQLSTPALPQANNMDNYCHPCPQEVDEVPTRGGTRHANTGNLPTGGHRAMATQRECLFRVLIRQNGEQEVVPCVRNCRGQTCGRENGHICSEGPGALGGGKLEGHDRARSDRTFRGLVALATLLIARHHSSMSRR